VSFLVIKILEAYSKPWTPLLLVAIFYRLPNKGKKYVEDGRPRVRRGVGFRRTPFGREEGHKDHLILEGTLN
jgi:hypothetical protein